MRLRHFAAAWLGLTVASAASAACPELEVAADIAQPAKAAADAGWALEPTLTFTAAAARRGAGSAPLYRQLVRPDCGTVLLRTPEGAALELAQATGPAAELIAILAMSREETGVVLPFMWDEGHVGLRKLALVYASSDGGKRAAQTVVMPKLRDAWAQSHVSDGHAHFRRELSIRYDLAAGADDGGTNDLIRRMLYETAFEFDRYARDEVPDQYYERMKPQG